MDDPGMASRLGEAGVRRVAARFTWRRTAERTLALYRRIIAERATPP
jgi:glycosyltransferase involved in cell wall biosynthesis